MNDNRTTELREMLTERGVEYRKDDASYTFATHWTDRLGRGCSFIEEVYDGVSKTIFVSKPSARNITPEQAIAATLGSERDKIYDAGFDNGVKACLQILSGYLDYPHSAVENISKWVDEQWKELGNGTCENASGKCSACGAVMYDAPNYCSNCARRVANEH